MPAFNSADKVNVTIDSVIYSIPRGVYSLKELAAFVGEQSTTLSGPPKYASMTLVSGLSPAQASPSTGNASVALYGNEVLTSVAGS